MNKTNQLEHRPGNLLSRKSLASRWECSIETVKRREREGRLKAIRFNRRLLRYRLEDIEAYEAAAQ
jgi:predicted site-specific integrase-resolvase